MMQHSGLNLVPALACAVGLFACTADGAIANPTDSSPPTPSLDLPPDAVRDSPLLQRWLRQVPNVMEEIQQDPGFRPRVRVGITQFAEPDRATGWSVGVEDWLVGRSRLALNGDYQATFQGDRESWGADLRYYTLPLGSYVNLAPVVGYRHLETPSYVTDGVNLGLRLLLVPSRTGAADLSLTHTWIAPGQDTEVGLTTLSFGYAVTRDLRLFSEIQKQNARQRNDSRFSVGLEWMF